MNDYKSYDDIIRLSHHVSSKHPHMARINRAAQFSPFAALNGYEAAIAEAAETTDEKIILDESEKAILDEKLHIIKKQLDTSPFITITYFRADEIKAKGKYESKSGNVRKIDEFSYRLMMCDGTFIYFDDIIEIEGDIFDVYII